MKPVGPKKGKKGEWEGVGGRTKCWKMGEGWRVVLHRKGGGWEPLVSYAPSQVAFPEFRLKLF